MKWNDWRNFQAGLQSACTWFYFPTFLDEVQLMLLESWVYLLRLFPKKKKALPAVHSAFSWPFMSLEVVVKLLEYSLHIPPISVFPGLRSAPEMWVLMIYWETFKWGGGGNHKCPFSLLLLWDWDSPLEACSNRSARLCKLVARWCRWKVLWQAFWLGVGMKAFALQLFCDLCLVRDICSEQAVTWYSTAAASP